MSTSDHVINKVVGGMYDEEKITGGVSGHGTMSNGTDKGMYRTQTAVTMSPELFEKVGA